MAPEERIGESKEVAAKRIYLGNAESRKKNKKGTAMKGMVMERKKRLRRKEKLGREGKRE